MAGFEFSTGGGFNTSFLYEDNNAVNGDNNCDPNSDSNNHGNGNDNDNDNDKSDDDDTDSG